MSVHPFPPSRPTPVEAPLPPELVAIATAIARMLAREDHAREEQAKLEEPRR